MSNPTIYGQAISEAKAELASMSAEFEKLAKRKARLEAFITNGEPLATPEGAFTPQDINDKNMPIWKAITLSINGKGTGFTVNDALQALERIGRPVDGKNRFQTVRNVLKRKDDVFVKVGVGKFALKH